MEKFLDAAYPGTAQQFIGSLNAVGATGFAWYLGGDNALHAWDISIVNSLEAHGFYGMAVYVPFLDHPGTTDGADAVRLAKAAGLPQGYKISLDVEPGVFASHPITVDAAYADGFNGQLHLAGYTAVSYGTPATVAAISNHADFIWVAVPGEPDPTTAGLNLAFFAGKRAVQWGQAALSGVNCDISNSEYSLAPALSGGVVHNQEDEMTFIEGPLPTGAIYDADTMKHVGPLEWKFWTSQGKTATPVDAATLAEMLANAAVLTPPATNLQPVIDAVNSVKADLDATQLTGNWTLAGGLTLKKV